MVGHRVAQDVDLQDVGDEFLCVGLEIRVHERDVVVAGDDVAERGEALVDAADGDGVGEGVAQVLQFLVGGGGREQQAVAVSGGEAPDDACAGDGGGDDGDDVRELGFEDRVEGFRGAEADERVGVG